MKVEFGHNVSVHYVGTFEDGTEFDNSRIRGNPLNFQVGDQRMIVGFSNALLGMDEGEKRQVTLPPEEAYGEHNPARLRDVPIGEFGDIKVEVGGMVRGNSPGGMFLAKILSIENDMVTLDMNHPLAGKELNFEIELLSNTGTKIVPEDPLPPVDDTPGEE